MSTETRLGQLEKLVWKAIFRQGNAITLARSFTFATHSPFILAPIPYTAGRYVYTRAAVLIEDTFDDPAATLSLGIVGFPSLFLGTGAINTQAADTYQFTKLLHVLVPSQPALFLTPGTSSQGSGVVLVELAKL